MKKIVTALLITLCVLGAGAHGLIFSSSLVEAASAKTNDSLAKEAYFLIEGNVFSSRKIRRALSKIEEAEKLNSEDPWVYLSSSMAYLVRGYKNYDWYELKNFEESSVEKSFELARMAVKLDSKESQTHAHLGRLYILVKDFPNALESLDRALRLDKNSFYPWYFKGILFEKQRKWKEAKALFDKAEKRAQFKYHHMILNSHRGRVALLEGNIAEKEKLLKTNIRNNPKNIWMYDNYADFLVSQKRYNEAIGMWKKAVSIQPYNRGFRKIKEIQKRKESRSR
jgi:tetratricopeptide (TPR) repeat protein